MLVAILRSPDAAKNGEGPGPRGECAEFRKGIVLFEVVEDAVTGISISYEDSVAKRLDTNMHYLTSNFRNLVEVD